MKYSHYRYIYPPRPKNAIPSHELDFWDNGSLIAQPKLNGSNTTIYINGSKQISMNRHNSRMSNFSLHESEISDLYRGQGWFVLNGEWMNKSKNDEVGLFNCKFVIFDILVYNGEYLVGSTFEERVSLLDNLYGTVESEKDYLFGISQNVYRVKTYLSGFKELYDKITPIDMIEGLVLKRKSAKLEIGNTENNNSKSQLKSRKQTKLYKY